MNSNKAIKAGFRDYQRGVKYTDNPMKHGPNTFLSGWWEKGWKQAEKESK